MIVKSLHRPVARLVAGALFIGAGLTAFAGVASAAGGAAGGNNGTVMINGNVLDSKANSGANDPHVTCPIVVSWSGFDSSLPPSDDFIVTFGAHSPTSGSVITSGATTGTFSGSHTETYYLGFTDAPQPNNGWHVDVTVETKSSAGDDFKYKTVWVSNCAPAFTVTKTAKEASAAPGDTVHYDITVTNNGAPTVGETDVKDVFTPGLDAGFMDFTGGQGAPWTCVNSTASATPSTTPLCKTTTSLAHGDSASFTVTAKVTNSANPPASVGDTVTASNGSTSKSASASTAVNAPAGNPSIDITKTGTPEALAGGAVSYTVKITVSGAPTTASVTDVLPTGFSGGTMTYSTGTGSTTATDQSKWGCSGLTCSTTSTLAVGDTVSFTVAATAGGSGVQTDKATVTWGANGTKSATADTQVDVPLTLSAVCAPTPNHATWTVTNPGSNPALTSVTVSNGTKLNDLAKGGSDTFTTAAPQTSLTVSGVSSNNITVTSNPFAVTSNCPAPPNPNETPATVSFSNTCSGFHAVFTTASLHTTQFVVTKPTGGTDTVNGSGQRDYAADATNSHISVAFDGVSQSADWVDPGGCTTIPNPPPAVADPTVSASNACKTGITVNLGNMNGTAPVTFTVTAPDNTVDNVSVLAGQIVKKSYTVVEDTTGTVTVSAPGLATKTFTYAKNCTSVLGEKVTKTPTPKPTPTVQGEKVTRLPFTGSNTSMFLTLAALLFAGGVVLMAFGARRRPEGKHL